MAPACPDPDPKNIECMCVYAYWGVGLFVQPLSSLLRPGLLPPILQVLILCECAQPVVATVDPLICSPHIDSTGGQRGSLSSSYHKDRTDESFTLTRSKQVF